MEGRRGNFDTVAKTARQSSCKPMRLSSSRVEALKSSSFYTGGWINVRHTVFQ